jgi:hypothetical protein
MTPTAKSARDRKELTSGFVRFDFLLTFTVADAQARGELTARCEGEWCGTRVGESTWEISSPASPEELEIALSPLLGPGDVAVFHYLADSKRFFRVVVRG